MIRSVEELDQWKYTVSDMIISIKGANTQLMIKSDNIRTINIIHRYTENIMPIIQVQAAVEHPVYKALTASEGDITIRLSLYKFISNSDAQAKQIVISKNFSIVNEYDVQPMEIRNFETNKEEGDSVLGASANQLMLASFYLVDNETIKQYRKNMSISVSGNLTTALAVAFQQRGFKHAFLNKIPSEYSGSVYIPSMNLYATIDYMNNKYGIFNTKYVFYMDLLTGRNYLIDRINLGECTEVGKPSIAALYLEDDGAVAMGDTGSKNKNNMYVINIPETPTVIRVGDYSETIDGSAVTAITPDNKVIKVGGGGNAVEKTVYVSNAKLANQISHRSKDQKGALKINLIDIDIDVLQPNILFKVASAPLFQKYNQINGDYRLDECMISLNKSTDTELSLVTAITLKEIVK